MSMVTRIETLENGKGFQYLLDAAFDIIHNPLMLHDTNYRLIAYTDTPVDDRNWNELVNDGVYSMETIRLLADVHFTELSANSEKSTMLKSDKFKYLKWLGNIYNKENVKVAVLGMYEKTTPFDAECIAAFEALQDKIMDEIKNDERYVLFGRTFHEDKIIKILDGIIDEPVVYTPQVQILYDGFEDFLYVAVIDISRCNIPDVKREDIKKMLLDTYGTFKYAIYSDYIIMLMSSEYQKIDENLLFNVQTNFFTQNNLYVGISSSFENMYELRAYYEKALIALKNGIGRENDDGRRVFYNEN